MEWDLLALIAAGGALGSLGRWGLAQALPADPLAWGTLSANILGCALLGCLLTVLADRVVDTRRWRAFAGVGVLGGFTTFSTAMGDAHALLRDGEVPLAVAEIGLGVGAGLLAVLAGITVTRHALGARR